MGLSHNGLLVGQREHAIHVRRDHLRSGGTVSVRHHVWAGFRHELDQLRCGLRTIVKQLEDIVSVVFVQQVHHPGSRCPHHAGQREGRLVAIAANEDFVPEICLQQADRFEPNLNAFVFPYIRRFKIGNLLQVADAAPLAAGRLLFRQIDGDADRAGKSGRVEVDENAVAIANIGRLCVCRLSSRG